MKVPSLFSLSFSIFLFSLFLLRYERQRPILPEEPCLVIIEGRVVEPTYVQGESQYVMLSPVRFSDNSPFRLDKVRLRSRLFPELDYGDLVRAEGKLSPYGTMKFPEVTVISSGGGGLRKRLLGLRKSVEKAVESALPLSEAGLLVGILLGSEGALSPSLEGTYRKAGLTHVVVASGYNMTVLLEFFSVIFSPFGKLGSVLLSLLGLLGYASILGWHPPVVRAFLMSTIGVFGLLIGRKKDTLRALLLSAVIMVFLKPSILDSLSFQLSFAATFGLIFLGNHLESFLVGIFDCLKETCAKRFNFYLVAFVSYTLGIFQLGENFSSTVAATLFIFPVVAYHFGRFSFVSLLANALLLWTTPIAMFFGLVALISFPVSKLLFRLILWCSWPFLRIFNSGAQIFAAVPLLVERKMSGFAVLLYYLFLFALCIVFLKFSEAKENKSL